MDFLRTPEDRFENLPDYPFSPNYAAVGDGMRMHYVDEGPKDGRVVLMLHGEPSWSYLYRKMIPIITAAGYRAVAPDLIGFGRSDKPTQTDSYSYAKHIQWTRRCLDSLDLQDINLVCQDWGGLIGLRLVAAQPQRFQSVVAANTFLPAGQTPNDAFTQWRDFCLTVPDLDVGRLINKTCTTDLSPQEIAAYDAPFPDSGYKAGARVFPALVPFGENVEVGPNKQAWGALMQFDKPFLTAFSDKDPITAGLDGYFQKKIPGAQGQPHTTIRNAGHFLQEDRGEALARVVVEFIGSP